MRGELSNLRRVVSNKSFNFYSDFITFIVIKSQLTGRRKMIALEMEKLTKRKTELEDLLKLMESKTENVEEVVLTLTRKLQARELDGKIRMKRDVIHHHETRIKSLKDQNKVQREMNIQSIRIPSPSVEAKISKERWPRFQHRVRLKRNTIFSWSYQKLS